VTAKRYSLPKRFNIALSDEAYANLRKLNKKYHYGNNYLLTLLLENMEQIVDQSALEQVINDFQKEYGAPKPAS